MKLLSVYKVSTIFRPTGCRLTPVVNAYWLNLGVSSCWLVACFTVSNFFVSFRTFGSLAGDSDYAFDLESFPLVIWFSFCLSWFMNPWLGTAVDLALIICFRFAISSAWLEEDLLV